MGHHLFRTLNIMKVRENNHQISIYLTDGYGDFPDKKPNLEVLWVVAPGG